MDHRRHETGHDHVAGDRVPARRDDPAHDQACEHDFDSSGRRCEERSRRDEQGEQPDRSKARQPPLPGLDLHHIAHATYEPLMRWDWPANINAVPTTAVSAAATSNVPTRRSPISSGTSTAARKSAPTSTPMPAKLMNRPTPSSNESDCDVPPASKISSITPGAVGVAAPTENVKAPRILCESAEIACHPTM